MSPRKYVLLDSSVLIGYYVKEAATNADAAYRARNILDAARNHHLDAHLYIPNMVVAEVFCQLARLCYSAWDKRISSKFPGTRKTLDTRRYKSACDRFRADIHNGALLYQYELNRYHILALDLIAPVDKHRKFYRKEKNVKSMGASDLLIGAMALHLTRVHGRDNVVLLSNDRRMSAIFGTAAPMLNRNTATKLGLFGASRKLGFGEWRPDLYPYVLDLARCKDSDLVAHFASWPLRTKKKRNHEPRA